MTQPMREFRTSKGEIITGQQLQTAREEVAFDLVKLAHDIRKDDDYASHVSEEVKEKRLREDLNRAEEVKTGKHDHAFWCWQLINEKLTGDCVPFLQKSN